jgi:hypothetical protein
MSISTVSKFDRGLHEFPICAICNKPVEKVESMYDVAYGAKRFRVYCHGDIEEAMLDDVLIEDNYSVSFGQAFIDKLPQPQLEAK